MSDSAPSSPPASDKPKGPRAVPNEDDAKPDAADAEPAARPKRARKPGGKRGPPPKVVEVAPLPQTARVRRRHWGIVFAFLLMVIAPIAGSGWYLFERAADQYGSIVGFTVRQEESGSATDMLGGFAASLSGSTTQKDTDILFEYMQSQDLVGRVNAQVDLIAHYSQGWPDDPVFTLWPDATIEQLTWFWGRIVRISYDTNSGLMEVRVTAFDPETAHKIATTLLNESQKLINELNAQARNDTMRYAEDDLAEAERRLRSAREALTVFRTRTQIVDPATDVQGRMGVVNTLQQQLAAALIERDLLAERTNSTDPRVTQAERRIEVIRERITEERKNFASGETTADGDDYPTLIAEYEGLIVDREIAEESYRAALIALESARSNANRQSRYLATYIQPTTPQTSEYPRRLVLISLIALFSFLAWSIMALIYYSIRDSR